MNSKIYMGINGFGRIGKSLLIQSIENRKTCVTAINAPGVDVNKIQSYLKYDTAHGKNNINVIVDSKDTIKIDGKKIKILDSRDPQPNMWSDYGAKYIAETTGKFLTKEKALLHGPKFDGFIMCAPAKDDTLQYVVGGNHDEYKGENIISNASCTTNCIVPPLKVLSDNFNITNVNFLTVHAATASQHVIDGVHLKSRIHRSIINNIIPHTTGASKSVSKVLPELNGKIHGTSVRIPTNNVSMVDLNIRFIEKVEMKDALKILSQSPYIKINNDPHMVSSDFMSTTCPSIIDEAYCMQMGENEIKLGIWYDNEWSYSSQVLKMIKHMNKVKNN